MSKIKSVLCNPITWIVVCLAVAVAAIVGVVIDYVSMTVVLGDSSQKFSFSLFDLLSSKNIDYDVLFKYTFSYTIGTGADAVTTTLTDTSSVAASYSDWSQLSRIGWVYAIAFIAAALAVIALALQVANKFVKKESVKEALYVSTNVVSFLLMLFALLALLSSLMIYNTNSLLINDSVNAAVNSAYEGLRDSWFMSELGMTYAEAQAAAQAANDFSVSVSCTTATASLSMMAGPYLLCIAGVIGGIFNLSMCSAKTYKLIK